MYCHYIGWCIGKCPLYRGVRYSECPLSEVTLYDLQTHTHSHTDILYSLEKVVSFLSLHHPQGSSRLGSPSDQQRWTDGHFDVINKGSHTDKEVS